MFSELISPSQIQDLVEKRKMRGKRKEKKPKKNNWTNKLKRGESGREEGLD